MKLANTTNGNSPLQRLVVQHVTGYHYLGSQLGMRTRAWDLPCGPSTYPGVLHSMVTGFQEQGP